jgi:amino acid adenylation domain-containing protein
VSTFAREDVERVAPATAAQRDLWLVDRQSLEASLSYCMALKIDLRGPVDGAAVAAAIQALYERHDALRITFSDDGDELHIHRPGRVAFEAFEIAELDFGQREAALRERCRLAVERRFDLRAGPVFRTESIAIASDHCVVLLEAHHIVCDGWSLGVLMADFGRLYARALGYGDALPPAPSFAEFAHSRTIASREMNADNKRFWGDAFKTIPAPVEPPTDRQRPPLRSFVSARMDYILDRSLIERIETRARSHGATVFSALFAAFNLTMSRISGNPDVVIGVPTSGQLRAGLPELVGYCIDFLPVRTQIDLEQPFLSLMEKSREQFRAAMAHRMFSFAELLADLKMRRDPSRLPLVNIMFTSLPLSPQAVSGVPGLSMNAAHVARPYENFELLPNVFIADEEVRIECQYNTALYEEDSVRGWFKVFETVLLGVADDFSIVCGKVPLVSRSDRTQLDCWNDTSIEFAPATVIHELVASAVRSHPDRHALSFGAQHLTYGELDAHANRLARTLRGLGAARGERVGLLVNRGLDMVIAQLAILKAGAAYVPLDPSYPAERLAYMAGESKLSLIVAHAQTQSLTQALLDTSLHVLNLDADADRIRQQSAAALDHGPLAASPDDPAYVIYTSGSTGTPKGVIVPHRAVVNFLLAMVREPGIAASDGVLALTTLSFDPAVLELLAPLIVGARVIVASESETHDGSALRHLLESSNATIMQATPSAWRMLIEAGWEGSPKFKALTGGESLREDLAQQLLARAGELWNLYGPTETTVWATCWKVEQPEVGISVGRPIANTTVWILDDRRQLCPIGVPGEIYIGGKDVALGYLNQPELTAERFIADPFSSTSGAMLYRTGDRGRWCHNGLLEYLGRLDYQMKVRGYRIEPGEIETCLAAHPRVASSVVIAREDRPGDVRMVAYVVSKGPMPGAVDLREHLRGRLPDYMIPQHFVALDAMPRLPNSKIDRNALPALGDTEVEHGREFVAPRTVAEIAIADIWTRLLGVAPISVTDNFFDLGGHSLLAASAIIQIEKELGVSLSTRQIVFESLGQIASVAARAQHTKPANIKPGWFERFFSKHRQQAD